MNYQTQQMIETMVAMMMMAMGVSMARPIMLQLSKPNKTYKQAMPRLIGAQEPIELPIKLKYYADSSEILTQTIGETGYRQKLNDVFQDAIRRVGRR